MAKASREPPDEALVVAAILGDLGAFDELVLRYRAAAVRAAQAIVGREDAEDVAQDALLLAFKALPTIEDPARFAAWLAAITRHRALRYSKQERARQAASLALDEVLLESVSALARPLVPGGEDEELAQALAGLPDDYALALRLRYLDEMPLKRIAAFLGAPVSTVKWRLHRGRELLREQVNLLRSGEERWKKIGK
ncbi:MAG TPA: RNA polymerase sigma factor [Blastocatellia bacterium]|nr:RNA polymerase sigma factor [Blastocatellia bacterium]